MDPRHPPTRRRQLAVPMLVAAAIAVGGGACRRQSADLPFGSRCDSDNDCRSGICLFQKRSSQHGLCTRPCELDEDDCPEGTSCSTIAEHGGKSVPVCGEPPPLPLGPGGPLGMPPGIGPDGPRGAVPGGPAGPTKGAPGEVRPVRPEAPGESMPARI